MYQDFIINNYLDYDKINKKYIYKVTIIDSNFTETVVATVMLSSAFQAVIVALIQVYSNRQDKNIAYYLHLLFWKDNNHYNDLHYPIEEQIKNNLMHIEGAYKYKEEILEYHQRYNNLKVFW